MTEASFKTKEKNSLWANRDFVKLWTGQTVSKFGTHITWAAMSATAVLLLQATPAQMGILGAFEGAPVLLISLLAGGLFGAGLLVSGMTDTVKVQGFLDIFGDWNPVLAFVMGGAMLPMAVAWRVAARRRVSVLGLPFPPRPPARFDRDLMLGSVLFGMGWALVGFCPGPAFASLTFGGWGGVVFPNAMAAAMVGEPGR